jgi:hypothetical protein
MLTIRPIQNEDLPVLSEFWYDNMAVLQQTNPRVRLLPDARRHWEVAMRQFNVVDKSIFLVAENEAALLGCIAGRITLNQPGLAPQLIGVVDFLLLDLHTPHKPEGTGHALLQAVKTYFIEQRIVQLQVTVAVQSVVAQAFWLGIGAKKIDDVFWVIL